MRLLQHLQHSSRATSWFTKVFFLTDDLHPDKAIYEGKKDKVRILNENNDMLAAIGKTLING